MKILYGVMGEGLGHTMRARALVRGLEARGHRVCVATSSRAVPILRGHGIETIAIDGLALAYRDGAVLRARSVATVARAAPHALRRNVRAALGEVRDLRPDAVVTDFDSFAYAVGRTWGLPIVSFDHQHVLDRCRHPRAIAERLSPDFRAARAFVRVKTPRCAHFVVTSFFFPPPRSAKTTLVGPVVRPEVAAARPTRGEHVVVYQSANGDRRLVPALLANAHVPFVVYGAGAVGRVRNVELRAFDEARFVADLASARGVIANGGFTTIAEALYLGKPVLSVPLRHQGEQELNAAYLAALGLGMRARRIDEEVVRSFVDHLDRFPAAHDVRLGTGNADAVHAVERALAEAA
ncbi:MAG: glycosyltransferase [Labilithrix sp.]|nr:glycosyltransferase [Labilithrix sp.]MCW5810702.1 glycosyltransferase [Labilithrix sp.]